MFFITIHLKKNSDTLTYLHRFKPLHFVLYFKNRFFYKSVVLEFFSFMNVNSDLRPLTYLYIFLL